MMKKNCINCKVLQWLKHWFNDNINPLKEAVDYLAAVSIIYILLYQIPVLRNVCKGLCTYFISWFDFLHITFLDIIRIYSFLEIIARVIIIVCIAIHVVVYIFYRVNEILLKKNKGKGRFEESLFRYLHDKDTPRCFLVTGQWGAGKSYEVNRFFESYYKYTITKVYRISCFGLSSRRELIEEINNTIEQSDKSFYAQISNVIQLFPVFGDALNKILKKQYSYKHIRKGSIFVFDDFERITSRSVMDEPVSQFYNHSLRSRRRIGSDTSEFEAINEEFKSVAQAFTRIDNAIEKMIVKNDYDKFINITGLINELIETYGMKTIVVCNTDLIGEKYISNVLKSKLNCIEYRKMIEDKMKASIIDDMISNKINSINVKQKSIEEYLNKLRGKIEEIQLDRKFDNMRLFSNLIEAFIDTAVLFDEEELSPDFLNSLFNTIYIIHYDYYYNHNVNYNWFPNGANIELLLKVYDVQIAQIIKLNDTPSGIRWVDSRVSSYWIYNLSKPENVKEVISAWKDYKYRDLEEGLLANPKNIKEEKGYEILHVYFCYKQEPRERSEGSQEFYKKLMQKALLKYDLNKKEDVEELLSSIGVYFWDSFNFSIRIILFDILKSRKNYEKVDNLSDLHYEYNRFLKVKEK